MQSSMIKMFDFEARALIGWLLLARVFASQPIRTRASKSKVLIFMLMFLLASIVWYKIQSCLIFMRTIARKRLVLFHCYDVKTLNLRMNQMSKV